MVVFKYGQYKDQFDAHVSLTVTMVVFKFEDIGDMAAEESLFNSNNGCI